jgi:DNA polymerase-3 subunit delta'
MLDAIAPEVPDASDSERRALVRAGEGSPGRALRFKGLDVATIDTTLDRLIADGDPTNAIRGALARSLAAKAAQPRYEAFLDRAPSRIACATRGRSGADLDRGLEAWERARGIASRAVRLSLDPQLTVFEIAGIAASLAPPRARLGTGAWPSVSTSPPRSATPMGARISGMPMRRSRPMRLRATTGCAGARCCSRRAPTSMA